MIDTINFRLNNVSRYKIIESQYQQFERSAKTVFEVDHDTGEIADNSKIRAIMHHDSDTITPLSKRSSLFIASSHYNVSYFYNYSGNFIDFNFAIPKYMYGTNILQFVQYFGQDYESVFKHLRSFVASFVKKHFLETIDYKDLELTRLDLCYNQFFNSKYDAMKYLAEQKELMKKHARSTKNDYRSYETSLMYTTKRYSFKIYHKGTEFRKHDRKELAKKNPTGYQIENLQDISDRILRYEVTFRKSQINYLFEKSDLHNRYVPELANANSHSWAKMKNPEYYALCMEFVEQSKRFVFANVDNIDAVEFKMVTFDLNVFKLLYDFFWQTVFKYQLRQKMSVYDVIKQIDAKNEIRDKAQSKQLREKLSFNKPMITVLALLTQHQSIDDLRKSGLMSKTTFYKYQKKLAELGIDSESRLTDIPIPPLDYRDYFYNFGNSHLK
ncbi:phage/plasmid replication domain-containing protein [Mucilaginibacter ginkgonis]|uniref:Replication-associated protein G2P N-terminal domain-containing protein n=1 Tax=Mucilaginibacter ginkgonis TaxID=2682091 RepID=A0A6I4HXK3_9SPHI|nr:phage/plasmid replication protein [Mucilaginibacter ginkgonis]QQL51098.1 hypothetical protein GO620_006510 [Mucilaginibacter ginkgonis]